MRLQKLKEKYEGDNHSFLTLEQMKYKAGLKYEKYSEKEIEDISKKHLEFLEKLDSGDFTDDDLGKLDKFLSSI